MKLRKITANNLSRIETGPLQVNEDWPGVFIRGDNAMQLRMALKLLENDNISPIHKAVINKLLDILGSCNVRNMDTK